MREENNVSKSWKRIFRKKWFFPALYLTIAALLLTGVLWYQNLDNQVPEATENQDVENQDISGDNLGMDEEAQPVLEQQEVVKMPVQEEDQAEIVTKFYDYSADSEDQEKALVLYNNKYYQSTGVDIASSDGESFEVTASLSGTVTEVKEDPLLGNVVKVAHANEVSTYYASLEEVLVEAGAKIQQGDAIGTAGKNLFGQASGTHVHFELRQGDKPVNPEKFFNQTVTKIEETATEEDEATTSDEETPEEEATTEEDAVTEEQAPQEDTVEDGTGSEQEQPEEDGTEVEDGEETDEDSSAGKESSAAMANA
ncbi:M23 family metallopeptidase [Sediminibacillus massiliensis]|uniref:M23 family metallopeptidase n=1 Tax=Sediminibacillus massiliensis TaxID=1926277 RepID=UPI0009883B97|nr:M23 family metallopeptidase [Sediminibacillus massiliensis]